MTDVRPSATPSHERDEHGSLPIAAYALLSDSTTAALVGTDGSVDWLCLPRFDAPAVFSRLLDPDAGHWSITPAGAYEVRRRYLPGTLVLETTFTTDGGTARLLDCLAFPEGQRSHDLGLDVPHELLRAVVGVSGTVVFDVEVAPRPEYGLVQPLMRQTEEGARTFGGPNQVAVRIGAPSEVEGSTLRARVEVGADDVVGGSLRWAAPEHRVPEPTAPGEVLARIEDVVKGWRSWEADHDVYDGPGKELVRFSARVLKGLTYRHTGAVVAAATTSLPEAPGGERNWDYRFSWIRDASFTMEALYIGACPDEAEGFVSWMTSSAGGGSGLESSLQIMYGVGGEHDLSERELGHLRGWRASRPVRVGNGAWKQDQLDVFGAFLSALQLYRERLGELHPEIQHFACELADMAARRWRDPDAGLWEMRGEPRHHVSSKLQCWVALDRAVRLAGDLGECARPDEWAAERDRIREAILEEGFSEERGAYAQTFGSDALDASALLMPLVGFLPAGDERMRSTIEAIERDLTEDGLVLRYQNEDGDGNADGLEGREGTFVICSFWLVTCLALLGEVDRAQALFDRLVGCANDVGLLAEELTPEGEQLGNTPQAYSHVGLINAARELDRARGHDG